MMKDHHRGNGGISALLNEAGGEVPPALTHSRKQLESRQVSQRLYSIVRTIGISPTPSYSRIAKAQATHRLRFVDVA
jgi:hypothetical protein